MQSIDSLFSCECCGGRLIEVENKKYKCDHCGQIRYIETTASTQVISMLNHANILRNKGEFDDAFDIFNEILSIESENADAYWGMFLCSYGIMHVLDPKANAYIPTCNRCAESSVKDNSNYKKALQLSNPSQAELFTETAEVIENIRQKLLKGSKKETPYDIFICYKRTLSVINGREVYTEDSVCARDIYDILTAEGYKVFFAEKTLQNLAGSEYEPIIYNALKTSKVMLVISSETELINAPWVKNEWLRFIKQMEFDENKKLIPIMFNGMKATSLPDKLKKFQGLEINPTFQTNLLSVVEKAIKPSKTIIQQKSPAQPIVETKIEYTSLNKTKEKSKKKNLIISIIVFALIAVCFGTFAITSAFEAVSDNHNGNDGWQDGSGNSWQDGSGSNEGNNNQTNTSFGNQYEGNLTLTSITIPKEIETISSYAFSGCSNLTTIFFEEGSNLDCINNYAFANCTKLESITLPATLTSIDANAFEGCSSLKNVIFESESNLISIGYCAFSDCKKLESINIPCSVNEIGSSCFRNCENLKSVDIPDNIETIPNGAFENCFSLESVNVSNNSNLTTIDYWAFCKCRKLASFNIPSKVNYIDSSAFYNCTKLVEINNQSNVALTIGEGIACYAINITTDDTFISRIITSNNVRYYKLGSLKIAFDCSDDLTNVVLDSDCVKINQNAFSEKVNLLNVHLPDSVTEIGTSAFSGCTNLTTIRLSKNLTQVDYHEFSSCYRLTEVINPSSLGFYNITYNLKPIVNTQDSNYTSKIQTSNNVRYYIDEKSKIAIALADKTAENIVLDSDCTGIHFHAFEKENIESIIIPAPVAEIGAYAFNNCSFLSSVTFNESSKLEHISTYSFASCSNLKSITIPASVNFIDIYAFKDASITRAIFGNYEAWSYTAESSSSIYSPLSEDDIEDEETAASYLAVMFVNKYWERYRNISANAYKDNTDLTTITISKDAGFIYESAFKNCSNLETVIFEEGSRLVEIHNYAFENCTKLKTIVLPSSVTYIGEWAFSNCYSLESLNIPSGVTTINRYCFENCTNLNRVNFEKGSQLNSIEYYAFGNCQSITSFEIQPFVENISDSAFTSCSRLVEINNLSDLIISAGSYDYGHIAQKALKITRQTNFTSLLSWQNGVEYYTSSNNYKYAVNCSLEITDLVIANDCNEINYCAFLDRKNIDYAYIPESIEKIRDSAFVNCKNLTTLKFKGNPSIGSGVFNYCYKLVEIINISGETLSNTLPSNVLVETTDEHYVSKIKTINNVKYFIDNETKIALGCTDYSATEITLESDTTRIYDNAFKDSDIKSIFIPTSVTKIGFFAFYECSLLISIDFETPSGWMSNSEEIDSTILDSDTNAAKYLKEHAFDSIER